MDDRPSHMTVAGDGDLNGGRDEKGSGLVGVDGIEGAGREPELVCLAGDDVDLREVSGGLLSVADRALVVVEPDDVPFGPTAVA